MTAEEKAAFDAMVDALYTIHEVDQDGDYATVNIDYTKVEEALRLVEKAGH